METTLYVQNLKCGGCAKTITTKLTEIKNISSINIDVEESAVSFEYQLDEDLQTVKNVLKNNGYPEAGTENGLGTKAKSFVSCAVGKLS